MIEVLCGIAVVVNLVFILICIIDIVRMRRERKAEERKLQALFEEMNEAAARAGEELMRAIEREKAEREADKEEQ